VLRRGHGKQHRRWQPAALFVVATAVEVVLGEPHSVEAAPFGYCYLGLNFVVQARVIRLFAVHHVEKSEAHGLR